jgi:hypothetical protein
MNSPKAAAADFIILLLSLISTWFSVIPESELSLHAFWSELRHCKVQIPPASSHGLAISTSMPYAYRVCTQPSNHYAIVEFERRARRYISILESGFVPNSFLNSYAAISPVIPAQIFGMDEHAVMLPFIDYLIMVNPRIKPIDPFDVDVNDEDERPHRFRSIFQSTGKILWRALETATRAAIDLGVLSVDRVDGAISDRIQCNLVLPFYMYSETADKQRRKRTFRLERFSVPNKVIVEYVDSMNKPTTRIFEGDASCLARAAVEVNAFFFNKKLT